MKNGWPRRNFIFFSEAARKSILRLKFQRCAVLYRNGPLIHFRGMVTKYFGDDIDLNLHLKNSDGTAVSIASLTYVRLLVFDQKTPNRVIKKFSHPAATGFTTLTVVDSVTGLVKASIPSGDIQVGKYGVECQFEVTSTGKKSGVRQDNVFSVESLKLGNV